MGKIAGALVISAAILGGSYLLANRYTVVAAHTDGAVWRADQLTGSMILCVPAGVGGDSVNCFKSRTPDSN